MTVRAPFEGNSGENQKVSADTSSAATAINANNKSVRFVNASSNVVHVKISTGTSTATIADTPLLPNSSLVVQKAMGQNYVSYIAPAGASELHIQPGEGGI